jgi:hypothetical protein
MQKCHDEKKCWRIRLAIKAGHAITICKGLHEDSSYGEVEAAAAVTERLKPPSCFFKQRRARITDDQLGQVQAAVEKRFWK